MGVDIKITKTTPTGTFKNGLGRRGLILPYQCVVCKVFWLIFSVSFISFNTQEAEYDRDDNKGSRGATAGKLSKLKYQNLNYHSKIK